MPIQIVPISEKARHDVKHGGRATFNRALDTGMQLLGGYQKQKKQEEQTKAESELVGKDLSKFSPEVRQALINNKLKGELTEQEYKLAAGLEESKAAAKYSEKAKYAKELLKEYDVPDQVVDQLVSGEKPAQRMNLPKFMEGNQGLGEQRQQPRQQMQESSQTREIPPEKAFPGIGQSRQNMAPPRPEKAPPQIAPNEAAPAPEPRQRAFKKPYSDKQIIKASLADKNVADAMTKANELAQKEAHHREETSRKSKERAEDITREDVKLSKAEKMEFHKESKDYDAEIATSSKKAKAQIETLKNIDKSLKSGNINPKNAASIFKNFGHWGTVFSNALLNKDEATLISSVPNLLEGWKEVFGVRLSDADLKVLQDKLPDIGKSLEANQTVVRIMKKYAEQSVLRNEIASDIKSKNDYYRPPGFQDKVEKRFDEMVAPVKIINPNNGKEIEIPAYKLSNAMKAGAKLANE